MLPGVDVSINIERMFDGGGVVPRRLAAAVGLARGARRRWSRPYGWEPPWVSAEAEPLQASVARAVDPDGAAERHRQARRDRRVVVGDEKDAMASLWALLPAPDATASYEWLSRLARGLGAEDPRGMDARRADLMVELLTGRLSITSPTPGPTAVTGSAVPAVPGKPLVHIVMSCPTLIGSDDLPAELAGYGPVPAAPAREIAADAVWKRLVVDPVSGAVLDHGRSTYRPPEALADFVRARDVHCRSPT